MQTLDHIAGHTWHGRKGAVENGFRYGVDFVLLDAEADLKTPRFFGRGKGALTSLWDVDHGGAPGAGRGAVWVRDVLQSRQIHLNGTIRLLAQPRVLGHVFNPVSFWLCHNDEDQLCAVIAEVTNTFGDRHSYLCHHADLAPIQPADRISAEKIFHVSPFQPVGGSYTFRFDISQDRVGIWIDYGRESGGLTATLTGRRAPLSNRRILGFCLRRPFGSRRVLALIHWQALRLWWKGATYRTRPAPPSRDVT